MSFWAYILRCADNSYYTGHTDNLEQRIGEHQQGLCGGYTSSRLPVELAFSQECATREEALAAEQQIKGWSRKKKEAMMRDDWAEVSRLAKGAHRMVRPSILRQAQDERGAGGESPTGFGGDFDLAWLVGRMMGECGYV